LNFRQQNSIQQRYIDVTNWTKALDEASKMPQVALPSGNERNQNVMVRALALSQRPVCCRLSKSNASTASKNRRFSAYRFEP
jgi:hypothetical protein